MNTSAADPVRRMHRTRAAQCISTGEEGERTSGGVWKPELAGNTIRSKAFRCHLRDMLRQIDVDVDVEESVWQSRSQLLLVEFIIEGRTLVPWNMI